MKAFNYTCTDSEGNRTQGTIKAKDKMSALSTLGDKGLTVTELDPADRLSPKTRSALNVGALVLVLSLLVGIPYSLTKRELTNRTGSHELMDAISKKQAASISQLLTAQPQLAGIPDSDGAFALHRAVQSGDEATVKALLDARVNTEVKDPNGATPLMWAVDQKNEAMVELLLEKGADINAQDQRGRQPLHYAAALDSPEFLQLLISKGADLESVTPAGTALHWAAAQDAPGSVEFLIEAGLDPMVKDKSDQTPLHYAAANDSLDTIQLLLEKGADKTAADNTGLTPLDLASAEEFSQVVKVLSRD